MNKNQLQEVANQIISKLKNMSQEEFERDVLKLNGIMSDELLEKVLKDVFEVGAIDSEELAYNMVQRAKITVDEFNDVFHYIEQYARSRGNKKDNCGSDFIDFRLYFHYRGGNFIWRKLIGQGTACQIYGRESPSWPEKSPLIYKRDKAFEMLEADTKIRFYKEKA